MSKIAQKIELTTVGEILKKEFMDPNHISAYFLAKSIYVPVSRIQDLIHDRRTITVDTSIRLARFFSLSDTYFINISNEIKSRKAIEENYQSFDKIIPFSNLKLVKIG